MCFQSQALDLFSLERDVTALHSLHISGKWLRQCCQGNMMVKAGYASKVEGSGRGERYNMKQE
jgi:hypothetical protein